MSIIHWTNDEGLACSALWRSERGAAAPVRVVMADDSLSADAAYRLACEGTALLWRGDFQHARQMLQALVRRVDKAPSRKKAAKQEKRAAASSLTSPVSPTSPSSSISFASSSAQAFHLHRQAQAQRARVLSMLLLPFNADYSIALKRAPDAQQACAQAWGGADLSAGNSVASLRELLGITSAYEWRKKGVEIAGLGKAPHNRIHPHYGVFSPVRGEYVNLVAHAPLPASAVIAFDIGTGSGVLAAVLARRGITHVVATDQDPRALACARDNLAQLGVSKQVQVLQADLFPEGKASLIVCNPPWLPARPSAPIEHAVYDEDSRMLLGFLNGLAAHLTVDGEGWLILSDFAEHLGLRSRQELLAAFAQAGLKVIGKRDAKPLHPKAADVSDALHAARAAEVTSLWRLAAI